MASSSSRVQSGQTKHPGGARMLWRKLYRELEKNTNDGRSVVELISDVAAKPQEEELNELSARMAEYAITTNKKSLELAEDSIFMGNKMMADRSEVGKFEEKQKLLAKAQGYYNQAQRKIPVFPANKLDTSAKSPTKLLELYKKLYLSRGRAFLESGQGNLFLSDAQKAMELNWIDEKDSAKHSFKYKTSQNIIRTLAIHSGALFQKARMLRYSKASKRVDQPKRRGMGNGFETDLAKAERKTKAAESMLQQAEFYLLYEAYWDYSYPDKDTFLKKTYRNTIRKVRRDNYVGTATQADTPENTVTTATSQIKVRQFTNLLERVNLVMSGPKLTARCRIQAGQVIFYEKAIALQSAIPSEEYCGTCYRVVERATPCLECTSFVFCSSTCRLLACAEEEIMQSHHPDLCKKTATLNRIQLLALELIAGLPLEFVKEAIESGVYLKCPLKEDAKADKTNDENQKKKLGPELRWRLLALSAFCLRMRENANFDNLKIQESKDRALLAQAFELTIEVVRLKKPKMDTTNEAQLTKDLVVNYIKPLFKLLYMIHYSPLAREDVNMIYSGKAEKPGLPWIGLGGFGGLLGFSCQPNVKRRFNSQYGNIEYVAKQDIKQDEELLVHWWGSNKRKPKQNCPAGSKCECNSKQQSSNQVANAGIGQ